MCDEECEIRYGEKIKYERILRNNSLENIEIVEFSKKLILINNRFMLLYKQILISFLFKYILIVIICRFKIKTKVTLKHQRQSPYRCP